MAACGKDIPKAEHGSDTEQGIQSEADQKETETNTENSELSETNTDSNNTATESNNEIVITVENWQEYLELKLVEEWGANGCYISTVLALNDTYADKEIDYSTKLDVEWSGTWVYKEFTCDKDDKTFTIGEILADKQTESLTKQSSFLTQLLSIEHYEKAQSVILIGGETDYYSYVKVIEDFEVLNISGTIKFK